MVQKKQILVIEDNALNRLILKQILENKYQVLEAENGQEGLKILKEKKDDIMLILLDMIMPVMDGYTFFDIVKKDMALSSVPVIVMTQRDSEADEVDALAHGATDFVPKPYKPQIILHRVASLIKLRETAAMVNQFKFDSLTGLYTKAFFYEKVKERLMENPDKDYCIVSTNIENFTLYNDSFGRKAGDALLKESAVLLQEKGGSDVIYGRYSGDRYLCLCENEMQQTKIVDFIEKKNKKDYSALAQVSIKFGVYEITDRTTTVEQMCDRALLAVESISGRYDQTVAVYDDNMREKMLREKAITNCMETALAENQFVVYYQPKVNLKDNSLAGTEALVRWINPKWGFMNPGEFIPLFEKNGFISRLDEYVWESVCRQLKEWKEKGLPLIPVSVNVSRIDIFHPHLVELFQSLLERYDISPYYLHLEITESVYTEHSEQIIDTVNRLRHLGFVIEMDDFGSGYSSLNILSQMSLDVVKLDLEFIQNELSRPTEKSLIEDVIKMAHKLNLSVVAEGVETRDQEKRLLLAVCDVAQGYLFSKPIPANDFEEMLKDASLNKRQASKETEESMKKMVVIDENISYSKKVHEYFLSRFDVICFSDEQKAIQYIEESGCEPSIELVSLSLENNGARKFIDYCKSSQQCWNATLIATVSCMKMLDDFTFGEEVDGLFCKSFPLGELARRIERLSAMEILHERESELRESANRDFLTGLLNRRGLHHALDELRKKDLPAAVYLFDLDFLKEANDMCGHEMSDHMLQTFADLLRTNTRTTDVICRYGGDEFVAILKNVQSEEDAVKIGRKICDTFHDTHSDNVLYYGCSCGVTMCRIGEIPNYSLIDRADRALYKAKKSLKGSCCMYEQLREEEQKMGKHLG